MDLTKLKRRWTELYYCFKYTEERLARAAALKAKYYHPDGKVRGGIFDALNNEKKYKKELTVLEKSFRDEECERNGLECRAIFRFFEYTEERFQKVAELKKKYAGPDGYFFGSVTTKGPHTKELEALEKIFAEEDRLERRAAERDDSPDDAGFPDLNPLKHIFKFNVSEHLNDPEYQAKYSRSRTGTDASFRESSEKTAPQRRENPPPLPERKPGNPPKARPAAAIVKSRNTVEVRDTAGNYVVSVGHGAASPIVGAYLNGDHVTVSYANGQVRLYDATSGHLIRTIS